MDIYSPLWTFALKRLSRLQVSKSSALGFYLFKDTVQINFSLWVIHKLTVLHMLSIGITIVLCDDAFLIVWYLLIELGESR